MYVCTGIIYHMSQTQRLRLHTGNLHFVQFSMPVSTPVRKEKRRKCRELLRTLHAIYVYIYYYL